MKNNHSSTIFGQQGLKCLFLSIFFTCTGVAAQDQMPASDTAQNKWEAVVLETSPFNFFYEKNSIQVSPENTNWRTLNMLFQYSTDSKNEAVTTSDINRSEIYHLTIDCIHKSTRIDQHIYYDKRWGKGEVTGTDIVSTDFMTAPSAIDQYFVDLACQDMSKPAPTHP